MTAERKKGFYEKYVKVPQDIMLAALALILFSPVMCAVAILVKIQLGSPVVFSQERAGKNGEPYEMYKFRSMSNKFDENGHLLPDAERLGKFGKTLRSTSLDELPSLLNVLLGQVALVGPRSLYVRYNGRYNEQQAKRLAVRPGITGLAQVNGRNAISWEQKFEYDVQYVENITFIGDWKIMFKTIGKVIMRDGISSKNSVTMEEFMGSDVEMMSR